MESLTAAVIRVNDDGMIVGLEGDASHFGLSDDLVGCSWRDFFKQWPQVPDLPNSSSAYPCCFNTTSPRGQQVSVELLRLAGEKNSADETIAFLREEETKLIAQQEQFYSLGELSAGVAHEINNALTIIHGWLDLILSDMPETNPSRSIIALLVEEADRIGRITRNLLDVARGTGREATELDVRQLLREVLGLVEYQMRHSDVTLESRLAPELPPIHGNSGRLKQALINLLINARQAMPSGGCVTVCAEPDNRGHLCISVQDTGCGISDESRQRIFSPFYTTKRDGTGLGLPVTRRIIEDHGGTIRVETKPGSGSRFTLRLPVSNAVR